VEQHAGRRPHSPWRRSRRQGRPTILERCSAPTDRRALTLVELDLFAVEIREQVIDVGAENAASLVAPA
jgi:hypothetical protein